SSESDLSDNDNVLETRKTKRLRIEPEDEIIEEGEIDDIEEMEDNVLETRKTKRRRIQPEDEIIEEDEIDDIEEIR
ncbi:8545_t:CDS:1, partial [Paraglomus occultum]